MLLSSGEILTVLGERQGAGPGSSPFSGLGLAPYIGPNGEGIFA